MLRQDGRRFDELRPIIMNLDVMPYAEGSVCIEVGQTKVFCAATIEERVPSFLRGKGKGWVTAEYSMLPRATEVRNMRESIRGKLSGRTMEIQRLIGRSLRSVVDLEALGERSVTVDCDVLHADGGTRTTSITGAFVAMVLAMQKLVDSGKIMRLPVRDFLASVSVGIHQNGAILDLNYEEDSSALVDMNVVKTGSGRYVEVQGTGEEATYSDEELMTMLKLSGQGIHTLVGLQRDILGSTVAHIGQSEPTNGEVR